ncbi:MAG: methyltransferase domain-containing protein [Sedimentisphaerales bacterium]|nr:methyltransferase domain-containing protein [Sedimentisphaerales bacterium]
MKTETHDEQMTQVYGHIYEDLYNRRPAAMDQARRIVRKNLAESGIQPEQLAGINVLNIGTGREAVVFHELGARKIYHFDVSSKSVGNLNELTRQSSRFSNLQSRRVDICEAEDLGISERVDFVYLSGVLHHLHDPAGAMHTLFNVLNPDARLFFRIYRSGCLAFFVVDFIRRFIRFDDAEQADRLFHREWGDTPDSGVLYQDLYDDFFVPVLRLFDPEQVNTWFGAHGFTPILKQSFPLYDHADASHAGQGWSLNYRLGEPRLMRRIHLPFPDHVDQWTDIPYAQDCIHETIRLMRQFLAASMKPEQRLMTALKLYKASQLYRSPKQVNVWENHERLQKILQEAISPPC